MHLIAGPDAEVRLQPLYDRTARTAMRRGANACYRVRVTRGQQHKQRVGFVAEVGPGKVSEACLHRLAVAENSRWPRARDPISTCLYRWADSAAAWHRWAASRRRPRPGGNSASLSPGTGTSMPFTHNEIESSCAFSTPRAHPQRQALCCVEPEMRHEMQHGRSSSLYTVLRHHSRDE